MGGSSVDAIELFGLLVQVYHAMKCLVRTLTKEHPGNYAIAHDGVVRCTACTCSKERHELLTFLRAEGRGHSSLSNWVARVGLAGRVICGSGASHAG